MKKAVYIILALISLNFFANAQSFKDFPKPPQKFQNLLPARIINNDTIIQYNMRPIVIMPPPHFKNKRQWRRYWRLVYNIKKVYPYAQLIRYYYYEVEVTTQYMDEKERKEYIKEMEKYLRKRFEKELINNLTYTQGRLLIKLVDRQTDHTTYEVIKQFKGNMSAQFWQTFARIFGANLKVEYKPKEEDRMIEYIIAQIENGQL